MPEVINLTSVLSKSGNQLSGTYTYSATLSLAHFRACTLSIRVTPDATGTGLTGATISVESRDSDNDAWQQVQTADLNTGTQDKEQAYGSGVMPSSTTAINLGPLEFDPTGLVQIRVGAKVSGSPKTNDAILINGEAVS
jgi:hypothetical protein